MGLSLYVVLGSAVVGLLVGLTGAGGGALMTPMLILLFSGQALRGHLQRPGRRGRDAAGRRGGAPRKGTVNLRLVGLMTLGSVPMAFLGSFLLARWTTARPASRTSRSHWARRCWSGRPPWCCVTSWTGGPGRPAPGRSPR